MSAFDDHFQRSALAAHRHERRGGGRLSTRLIRLDSPAHTAEDAPTDELVMGLIVGGSAGARWSWDGARPNTSARRRPGTLGLTPPGAAGRFEVGGPSVILIVALPYPALKSRLQADAELPEDFGRLHDAYVDHPNARGLALRMWRAAGRAGFDQDLLIDALSERLLLTLAEARPLELNRRSGLGAIERRHVLSRAQDPTADVADLALAAAMPVRTFRRRFRAAFGLSPQAWLADLRIRRARDLLIDGGIPLSQAALDLGFASQAHFTQAFREAVGVTPGRYRRELRS